MKAVLRGLAFALPLAAAALAAQAAELVMFEERGCAWCARFDAEIGPIYPKTAEAARAPLRRVDLARELPPDLAGLRPVTYTPTFVLIEKGLEVGRIQGYPGEMHFWGLLGMLLERLGPAAPEGG